MKKFFFFAVMMLMSTAAFAIDFGFAAVEKVAQSGDKFYAYTSGESIEISAWQYRQMKDADGWYVLDVDGKKVVAAGDEFIVEELTVDSVGLEAEQPKVYFADGSSKVFTKAEWLKALKGQKVRRAYLNIPTWEYENYSTVDEGQVVVCHSKVAPTKKATAKAAPAPVAQAATQASAAPAAPAQSTTGNSGITFRVTKK